MQPCKIELRSPHVLLYCTMMQELAMPVVVSGQSTVIAAETGSGKTLAYLAPVASMLLRQKERLAADPK